MAAKRKKAKKTARGKGKHGRRRAPSPSQLAKNPPVDVLAHIGNGPFEPTEGMLACLSKVACDPTLASSWRRIAKAADIPQANISYWCGNMSFLAWWHDQVSRIQSLKVSEAVAVLAEIAAAKGAKESDRIAAAKAYHACVDKDSPGADAGMAALMRAMAGSDADVELKATKGDDVLEVRASTRKRIVERVEARERVGGILDDAASFGVFQAAMPKDAEVALEQVAYEVIQAEDVEVLDPNGQSGSEANKGPASDNESYRADNNGHASPSLDPNLDAFDPWAEDSESGDDEGGAGSKSRATTPHHKAPPAHSPLENEPPSPLFLDIACPSCQRVLMKVRQGMSIPEIACPHCEG